MNLLIISLGVCMCQAWNPFAQFPNEGGFALKIGFVLDPVVDLPTSCTREATPKK
jgi:hypothetical protein